MGAGQGLNIGKGFIISAQTFSECGGDTLSFTLGEMKGGLLDLLAGQDHGATLALGVF